LDFGGDGWGEKIVNKLARFMCVRMGGPGWVRMRILWRFLLCWGVVRASGVCLRTMLLGVPELAGGYAAGMCVRIGVRLLFVGCPLWRGCCCCGVLFCSPRARANSAGVLCAHSVFLFPTQFSRVGVGLFAPVPFGVCVVSGFVGLGACAPGARQRGPCCGATFSGLRACRSWPGVRLVRAGGVWVWWVCDPLAGLLGSTPAFPLLN